VGLICVGDDEDDEIGLGEHGVEVGPWVEGLDVDGGGIDSVCVTFGP
jgi:hypothetical protein